MSWGTGARGGIGVGGVMEGGVASRGGGRTRTLDSFGSLSGTDLPRARRLGKQRATRTTRKAEGDSERHRVTRKAEGDSES